MRAQVFSEVRTRAINAIVSLTGKLATLLATTDLLSTTGYESRALRCALMQAIHTLHAARHALIAVEVQEEQLGEVIRS